MWETVAIIDSNTSWQLTDPIKASLFRIRQSTSSLRPTNLRGVIAQAIENANELTLFDSRRLVFKPELEAFLFLDPGRLFNRRLAVKRLDNLLDNWTIVIEVLPEVGEINLPIEIGDVSGLAEQLSVKEASGTAAAVLEAHLEAANPHPQYKGKLPTPNEIGAELAGTSAALLQEHLATVDPHLVTAIHVDYEPEANSLLSALNAQSALNQLAVLVAQLQTQIRNITPSEKPSLVVDPFVNSDGKELKDHYPITYQGSTWVQRTGKFYFIGNRLRGDGTAQSLCYIESSKSTAIAVVANIILRNITTPQGIVLRFSATNGYHIRVVYSGTKFELLEVSGSTASRANLPESITFDQAYRFKILLEGPKITLLVNGVQKLTWSTAFNQGETKHGLYPSSSTTTQFEDFEIIQLSLFHHSHDKIIE